MNIAGTEMDTMRLNLESAQADLAEAQETLDAIRSGAVDGLVVTGVDDQRVFTLTGAHEPYRLLIEQMSEGALTLSIEGLILFSNLAMARLLGKPLETVIGKPLSDFVDPADQKLLANLISEAVGGQRQGEIFLMGAGGSRVPVHLGLSPLQIEPETFISAVITDLSDIRGKEERFSAIVNGSEDAIIGTDREGVVTSWNSAAERIFGYQPNEMIGHPHSVLVPPVLQDEKAAILERVWHGESSRNFETTRLRKDGTMIEVSNTTSPISDGTGTIVGASSIMRDISDRRAAETKIRELNADLEQRVEARTAELTTAYQGLRQTETALREGEERMRLATEATGVGIWEWNVITGHIVWNAQMFRIYGIPPTPNGVVVYGTWADCVLPEDLPEQEQALQETIRDKKQGSRNFRILHADTGESRYIHAVETVRKDGKGQVEWVVGTNLDITERQRAEEELRDAYATLEQKVIDRTEELVKAKQRAEEADANKTAFLSAMSHELRTPLNSVIGFTGILLMQLAGPLNDEQTEHLSVIQSSSRHLLSLLNDLLDMARIDAGRLTVNNEMIDCGEVVNEVGRTLEPLAAEKGLTLTLEVPQGEAFIETDRRILIQILINLVNNAVKYTSTGTIKVGLTTRPSGEDNFSCFYVVDTGKGIKQEDQAGLFQPFSQVDGGNRSEGNGLGLSLSRKLAKQLNGWIEFESEFGVGSCFTLVVPQTNQGAI